MEFYYHAGPKLTKWLLMNVDRDKEETHDHGYRSAQSEKKEEGRCVTCKEKMGDAYEDER